MNAHDQLERQLRASVARAADRRPAFRLGPRSWSRGLSVLIVAASTAVALGVAVFALVALHHGRPPSAPTPAPATTQHHRRLGPRPRDPGPIPRNVDDGVIAAAWNTAWREDPVCRGGSAARPGVSNASPSAAMLATIPTLRRPATAADRLPARFYVHGQPAGRYQFRRRLRALYPSRPRRRGDHLLSGASRQARKPATIASGRKPLLSVDDRSAASRTAEGPSIATRRHAPIRRCHLRAWAIQPRNLECARRHVLVQPTRPRQQHRRRPEPIDHPAERDAWRERRRDPAHADRNGRNRPRRRCDRHPSFPREPPRTPTPPRA